MDRSIYNQKVSLSIFGEFLFTCITVGEDKVLTALRSIRKLSNPALKKYIMDVTCDEFELHPSYIYNDKITRFSADQKICFCAIIFLIKKHMGLSYKEIVELLNIKMAWQLLSKYNTVITKLDDHSEINKRYLRLINSADKSIKNYILNNYIKQNGEEK